MTTFIEVCFFFFFFSFCSYRQTKEEVQRPCNYHQLSRRRNNTQRMRKLNFSFLKHSTRDAPLVFSPPYWMSATIFAVSFSLFPSRFLPSFTNGLWPFPPTSPTPVIAIVKKNLLPGERKCDVPSYFYLIIIISFCRDGEEGGRAER